MSQPYTLPCGTHAGYTLQQILEQDPAYLEQCVKTALLLEQLPAMQGLLPELSSGVVCPPAAPRVPSAVADAQTSPPPSPVAEAPLIDLSVPEIAPPPPQTRYDELRDLVFAAPAGPPPTSSTASGYSLGRADTPDAVQQLQMLYPDASSTAIQLLYQLLPVYPGLTLDTLCVQCGQPFSRHQGLSCPTLLTGAFIPSTTTLTQRV